MVVGNKLSARRIFTLLAQAAIVTMAGMLLFSGGGREASAAGGLTFDVVFCMDVYFDGTPLTPPIKGEAPGVLDERKTKILSRIEPHPSLPNTWNVTSVAYSGPGILVPEEPPSAQDCKTKGDGNSLIPAVPFQTIDLSERPTATATIVSKPGQNNLTWVRCQFEADLLGGRWVESIFDLVITGKTLTQDFGILTAKLYPGTAQDNPPPCGDPGPEFTFVTILDSTVRVKTIGEPSPSFNDDWDGDGCSDWDELADPPPDGRDPFNPNDCGVVGGIAALPEVASAPAEALESSGAGTGLIIGLSVVIAAAALALGSGAWYLRRRRRA
ncbi:MAG: hypothetical protein IH959_05600 [Chloroflexi bacterium]|nr:hypothetical protein [Chloroflexota bacterium]